MSRGWGVAPHTPQTGNGGAVNILIAAPPDRVQGFYAALVGDARFRVIATATSADDVRAKLGMNPEALLVEAVAPFGSELLSGPEELAQVLGGFGGVCFLLLPGGTPGTTVDKVRAVRCVKEVVVGDANFPVLAGRLYDTVMGLRTTRGAPTFPNAGGKASTAMAGWRAIAVWSPLGGVGKSTLATALALEASNRRLPTLLVGLGAPDIVPLRLGLRAEPNLLAWTAKPTPEGLRAAIQKKDVLDVLAGFPDQVALGSYAPEALDGQVSLPGLASCAAYAGYGVVVFDVSAQELAPAGLSACNTLVLVVRPTLDGVLGALEAVRLVNDCMAGQHRIPKEAIYVVVNRVRKSTLTPQEVMRTAGDIRPDFPPLAAWIPDDPEIEQVEGNRRPAYYSSDGLREAAKVVGDKLFAAPPVSSAFKESQMGKPARVIQFGPIKVKV